MKLMIRSILAGGCLAAIASQAANAAVVIDTNFNLTSTSVTPNTDNIADATSIGFFLLPISNIITDNTGIILFGTLPVLTNPVPVETGASLSFSWTTANGTFSDALSEVEISGVPNTSLTVTASGTVSGPPGFSPSPTNLTLSFTEHGVGFYGLSGHLLTVAAATVPEASTWLMMLCGFGGLGLAAYRKARSSPLPI